METFLQTAAPENIMTNNEDKKRILIDINYTLWQKYFRQGFRKIIEYKGLEANIKRMWQMKT